jgi:hypothetical protein
MLRGEFVENGSHGEPVFDAETSPTSIAWLYSLFESRSPGRVEPGSRLGSISRDRAGRMLGGMRRLRLPAAALRLLRGCLPRSRASARTRRPDPNQQLPDAYHGRIRKLRYCRQATCTPSALRDRAGTRSVPDAPLLAAFDLHCRFGRQAWPVHAARSKPLHAVNGVSLAIRARRDRRGGTASPDAARRTLAHACCSD